VDSGQAARGAVFIGFTGTPRLKADRQKSIEVFGRYIHTYKFDQAVREGVVLDLRYEARDIDQAITSQKKIDEWFDTKTQGLNDLAKARLKQKWGTMQRVLSSQSRLMDGHGNLPLHRQADAQPRPVSGDMPRQPARWRQQGIWLHRRLQGLVQAPGGRREGLLQRRARWF
jgi:superfamily II DNA or RNA helicase